MSPPEPTAGTVYEAIPYGSPLEGWTADEPPRVVCHDCLVSAGEHHLAGCDFEVCGACGEQLVHCEHDPRPLHPRFATDPSRGGHPDERQAA